MTLPPLPVVTERQLEVLRLIGSSVDERGFPPTLAELATGLGISPSSTQAIHEHITGLARAGLIIRHARVSRGLTLTAAARELLARLRAMPTGEHTK